MISHKHKCIFLHIPKTAGMSIYSFFHPDTIFYQNVPNYDILFGWCPYRKIHLQHATSKQLIETGLISHLQWEDYFKFAFVRNPWDRAYSDFKWIQEFSGIKGSFKDYIEKKGPFIKILNDNSSHHYLGDHLLPQLDFFDLDGSLKLDFLGKFENFKEDISYVLDHLKIKNKFGIHLNESKRVKNYSNFYTNSRKRLVERKFEKDIIAFEYSFNSKRTGINVLKKYL